MRRAPVTPAVLLVLFAAIAACGAESGTDGAGAPAPASGGVGDDAAAAGPDAAGGFDDGVSGSHPDAGGPPGSATDGSADATGGGGGGTDAAGADGATTDGASVADAAATDGANADGAIADGGGGDGGAAPDAATDVTCGPCTAPPTACHAPLGRCVAGTCTYVFVDGATCDDGDPCTVADACGAGACRGVPRVCNTPPAPVCTAPGELRSYSAIGACTAGVCVYAPTNTTCASGCVAGACASDPCAGVTCNAPPAPSCRDATTLVVHGAGTCSQGACAYAPQTIACVTGCSAGRCNPSGWTRMTSPTNLNLSAVWGSSASAVWAAGANGTLLFFNGVAWQVRAFPSVSNIYALSGTGPSNAYAATYRGLYRWDGATWTLTTSSVGSFDHVGLSSFAPGAAGTVACAVGSSTHVVQASFGGTLFTSPASYIGLSRCQLAAFAFDDVFVTGEQVLRWNGTAATPVGANAPSASALWGLSPSFLLAGRNQSIYLWNGATWTSFSGGLRGDVRAFSGTTPTRAFAAIADGAQSGGVVSFDGLGWSVEPLPAPVPGLDAVYAAPTGEVFAVGRGGAIFRGP